MERYDYVELWGVSTIGGPSPLDQNLTPKRPNRSSDFLKLGTLRDGICPLGPKEVNMLGGELSFPLLAAQSWRLRQDPG